MANYTYFVMTPGVDVDSFVQYKDGKQGNYFKFGDQGTDQGELGIRTAYLTHNPDIAIACVMKDGGVSPGNNLGTLLKKSVASLGFSSVNVDGRSSEWFSVTHKQALALFIAMQKWDKKTIDKDNIVTLTNAIKKALEAK